MKYWEGSKATCVVEVLSVMAKNVCVNCWWFVQYVSNEWGAAWDFFLDRLKIGKESELQGIPMKGITVQESAE